MEIKCCQRSRGTEDGSHKDADRGAEIGWLAASEDRKQGATRQRPSVRSSEPYAMIVGSTIIMWYPLSISRAFPSLSRGHGSLLSRRLHGKWSNRSCPKRETNPLSTCTPIKLTILLSYLHINTVLPKNSKG